MVGIGILLGVIFGRLLGESPITSGVFAGISTLAIVAAMNDTNGGLYMALMGQYGQPRDVGAYSVMSLESGPFLTMVTLGVAGLSAFPWPTLIGAILPLGLTVALTALEILVAFLQAYVFTILTCIYLNDAIHPGH